MTPATTEEPQKLEDAIRIVKSQEHQLRNEVKAQSAVHPLNAFTAFLRALNPYHAFVPCSPGTHVSKYHSTSVLLNPMVWREQSRIDHRVTLMKLKRKPDKKVERFDDMVKGVVRRGGIILVDGDNVRGKSNFELTHLSLLRRIARWAHRLQISGHVVLLVDHGSKAYAYHLPRLAGVSVAFSGPVTADDIAVRAAHWFHECGTGVILVSADMGLSSRCGRYVRGVTPPGLFLKAIGYRGVGDARLVDDYMAASRTSSSIAINTTLSTDQLRTLESEMRIRTQLTKMDRQNWAADHRHRRKAEQRLDEVLLDASEMGSPSFSQVVGIRNTSNQGNTSSDRNGLPDSHSSSMHLSTDEQDAIMAALIQRRLHPPFFSFRDGESTYQRVVLAEVLRRRLEHRHFKRLASCTSNTVLSPAAEYVASFTGDPLTSFGVASRNQSGHAEGTLARLIRPDAPLIRPASNNDKPSARSKDRAGRYSRRRPASSPKSEHTEVEATGFSILSPDDWTGKFPLRYLFVRSEQRVQLNQDLQGFMTKRARQRKRAKLRQYMATTTGSLPPPLQAIQEPLQADDANKSKWTRLVVLSETHGEEAMLTEAWGDAHAKDNSSGTGGLRADVFLPIADVLVHCGGWSHRDRIEENANAQADFDTWLSKQPQRHKLIVRNRHDPLNATFPLSKAVYVTKPSSVQLANIRFACMPYSRTPPQMLPKGDVMVTYRPPKHASLRSSTGEESVLKAIRQSSKPRVWLFGHSNKQATGTQRVYLGTRSEAPTTMVNAANGDSGSNRQLVAGPVVMDVETPQQVA